MAIATPALRSGVPQDSEADGAGWSLSSLFSIAFLGALAQL